MKERSETLRFTGCLSAASIHSRHQSLENLGCLYREGFPFISRGAKKERDCAEIIESNISLAPSKSSFSLFENVRDISCRSHYREQFHHLFLAETEGDYVESWGQKVFERAAALLGAKAGIKLGSKRKPVFHV